MKKTKKIVFVEGPVYEGSNNKGTELSYQTIKQTLIVGDKYLFFDNPLSVATILKQDVHIAKHTKEVITKCENVRINVLNSLNNEQFPIIIGGDHSVAMASIAAGSETFGIDDYVVVYIDGHADINTEQTSVTHNIHGMPLASSLGLCSESLQVGPLKKKIKGDNLFIFGARSIDPPEYDIIKENGVHLFENRVFLDNDYGHILMQTKEKIGNKKVHISFDVDVLDPEVFSSTGYLMKDGLSLESVLKILDFSFDNLDVVSMDIVEYNPLMDKDEKDLKTLLSIINVITHKIFE